MTIASRQRAHRFLAFALLALLLLRGDMYPDASNAKLPQAHDNLFYTPAVCDGFVSTGATGATMSAGSAVLTHSSGKFLTGPTPAKVGQLVSVNAAATAQSAQSVAIVAGGMGYKALDTLTMADGTVLEVLVAGRVQHEAVLAASTGDLAGTYDNGSAGQGATLTATALGAFVLDGQAGVSGGRYMLKNQAVAAQNGVYVLTTVGTAGTQAVLTRSSDFNQVSLLNPTREVFRGAYVGVTAGTVNTGTSWTLTTAGTIVLGTTNLTFAAGTGGVVSLARVKVPASTTSPVGAASAPSATSGAGTGVTATLTYRHDNLLGTVASVQGDTQMTLSVPAGSAVTNVIYGYGSDVTAAVQGALSGGTAQLPAGSCGLASTITLKSGDTFRGRGSAATGGQTTLLWLGANNGTQLSVATGAAATGIVVGDFMVDGLGSAATGIMFKGLASPGCRVLPISTTRQRVLGVGIDSYAAESQHCLFDKLESYQTAAPSTSADGIYVGMVGNVNHHTFSKLFVQHKDGRGIVYGATDSNSVVADMAQQPGGGAGKGIVYLGHNNAQNNSRSTTNQFLWQEAIAGLYIYGTESGYDLPSQSNSAWINRVSGMPSPIKDDSARFFAVAADNNVYGDPAPSAFFYKPLAKIFDYTLLNPTDAGQLWSNYGAVGPVVFTLPPAIGGGWWGCFRRIMGQALTIRTDPGVGTDKIMLTGGVQSNIGGSVNTTAVDGSICLVDVDSAFNTWRVLSGTGQWNTDNGLTASYSVSGTPGTAWTAFTPTLGCGAGTLTTAAGSGRYNVVGKTVSVVAQAVITTNGTCATSLTATVPAGLTPQTPGLYTLAGRASISTKAVYGVLAAGSVIVMRNYDGTYPGANGETVQVSGVYEAQ